MRPEVSRFPAPKFIHEIVFDLKNMLMNYHHQHMLQSKKKKILRHGLAGHLNRKFVLVTCLCKEWEGISLLTVSVMTMRLVELQEKVEKNLLKMLVVWLIQGCHLL